MCIMIRFGIDCLLTAIGLFNILLCIRGGSLAILSSSILTMSTKPLVLAANSGLRPLCVGDRQSYVLAASFSDHDMPYIHCPQC